METAFSSHPAGIGVTLLLGGGFVQGITEVLRHGLQGVCLLAHHGSSPESISENLQICVRSILHGTIALKCG